MFFRTKIITQNVNNASNLIIQRNLLNIIEKWNTLILSLSRASARALWMQGRKDDSLRWWVMETWLRMQYCFSPTMRAPCWWDYNSVLKFKAGFRVCWWYSHPYSHCLQYSVCSGIVRLICFNPALYYFMEDSRSGSIADYNKWQQ